METAQQASAPAPASLLTASQRTTIIKERVHELTKRMPRDWCKWDVYTTRNFKDAVATVSKAGTLPKARAAAQLVAVYYGVSLAQLDPGEV